MHKKCTPSEKSKTYNLKFKKIKEESSWHQIVQYCANLSKK